MWADVITAHLHIRPPTYTQSTRLSLLCCAIPLLCKTQLLASIETAHCHFPFVLVHSCLVFELTSYSMLRHRSKHNCVNPTPFLFLPLKAACNSCGLLEAWNRNSNYFGTLCPVFSTSGHFRTNRQPSAHLHWYLVAEQHLQLLISIMDNTLGSTLHKLDCSPTTISRTCSTIAEKRFSL